jgi:hypothetical protein
MPAGYRRLDLRVAIAESAHVSPRRVQSANNLLGLAGAGSREPSLSEALRRAKQQADAQLRVLLASPLMQAAGAVASGGPHTHAEMAAARQLTAEQRQALLALRQLCIAFLEDRVEEPGAAPATDSPSSGSDRRLETLLDLERQLALPNRLATASEPPAAAAAPAPAAPPAAPPASPPAAPPPAGPLCTELLRQAQALRAPLAALISADAVNLSTRFVVALTPCARASFPTDPSSLPRHARAHHGAPRFPTGMRASYHCPSSLPRRGGRR